MVLPNDPSFRGIGCEEMDHHLKEARRHAEAQAQDAFLLCLMRLLALSGNGHTRLIPNDAISVLPLRFVTIGTAVHLVAAQQGPCHVIGSALIAINGVPVRDFEGAATEYLSGTPQRQRVIGPILLTWPAALARLGISSGTDTIVYTLRDDAGDQTELQMDRGNLVPGATFYPRNEHGKADAAWHPKAFAKITDYHEAGLHIALPSFADPSACALSNAVRAAAEVVTSRPSTPLLLDLRGNTGGDFLQTMPLIDAITQGGGTRRVGVLVDKFTFSAAIVFVAILKHRLGDRLELIGEEMGDDLTFFAEGGLIDLPNSGAVVRYSSAFHDWAGGRVDETTPPEIADQVVPAGRLQLDQYWVAKSSTDTETPDPFCRRTLEHLRS